MSNKLTKRVEIRLSEKDYFALSQKAKQADISVSELLRQGAGKAKIIDAVTSAQLRQLTIQVARAGNNLNQLARHCNEYKQNSDGITILTELLSIKNELKELREYAYKS